MPDNPLLHSPLAGLATLREARSGADYDPQRVHTRRPVDKQP
jgi:hypothetical protein